MKRALRLIFVVGGLLTLLGLIMIPLPGPGNLFVSLGLQVLAVGLFLSVVSWLSRRGHDSSRPLTISGQRRAEGGRAKSTSRLL